MEYVAVISDLSCSAQSGPTDTLEKKYKGLGEQEGWGAPLLKLFALFIFSLDVTWPGTRCASLKARRHAGVI